MAVIDFPASPTDGQIFNAPNGTQYRWNAVKTAWLASALIIAAVTPPTIDINSALILDSNNNATTGDAPMQITQGTAVFTRIFQALNPANPISVDITSMLGGGTAATGGIALFIDGNAASVAQQFGTVNTNWGLPLRCYWQGVLAAGPHTFQLRFGSTTGMYLNGAGGVRYGGGSQRTIMTITELGGGVAGPIGPPGPAGTPGGPACSSGPTPPVSPVPNQLWYNTDAGVGGGVLYIWYDDGNSQQWIPASQAGVGPITAPPTYDTVNTLLTDTSGFAGNTDIVMPITIGTQVFSRSFTALDASHPIEVDFTSECSAGSTGIFITYGLFIDGATNAVAQKTINSVGNQPLDMRLYWQGVLGAGAHTYQIRFASSSTGTSAFLNGNNTSRFGGGAMRSTMTISEIGVGVQGPPGPQGAPGTTSAVVGAASARVNTVFATAAVIPSDDSLPQITEGAQLLTLAYTVKTTGSKLRLRFSASTACNASCVAVAALFRDALVDAIAAGFNVVQAASWGSPLVFEIDYTHGSPVSTVINLQVRVGTHVGSSTVTINGTASARLFGGAAAAVLSLEEIV